MRFGFHISIAGGLSKVVQRAEAKGCEAIQIFSRNPRGWRYAPLDLEEVAQLKEDLRTSGISPLVVHMPYLANLASHQKELYSRSIDSLCEDLRRAQVLGAPYLIVHVGRRLETTEPEALKTISRAINEGFERVENEVVLLLENTAGQGTELGFKLGQVGAIIEGVEDDGRMGVCLDTAHAFQAGYDLSTSEGLEKTLKEFDHEVGLDRLRLLHLNDSKTRLGSRVDRHWHIGEGCIGLEGFRNIVNHPQLVHLPGIMETPREGDPDDLRNMKTIRSLVV